MEIADAVWATWRERETEFKKPSIDVLLTADAPPETTLSALADAVHEAMRPRLARGDEARPGEDEFRTGSCSSARVPQGVLLRIDEGPDDFEGLLRGIARGLQARGIVGMLDAYEPDGVPDIPDRVDLFECHLRLAGERASLRNGKPTWQPAAEALARAAEAGIAWCRGNGACLPLSLRVGLLAPALLGVDDDVHGFLREAVERTRAIGCVELTSAAPDRFRTFALTASTGRAGLLEGGAATKDDWAASARRAIDAMREFAPWSVYGFVKRGSLRVNAVLGTSLPSDWLEIPHMNALILDRQAFEDRFVPDAFGAQLLSAGHRGHVPEGPDWRVTVLASGRALVEHTDTAAWFDGNLVRFGGHPNPFYDPYPPTPELLLRARADFDAILYKDRSL